jgi:hypothetical protein
MTNHRNELVLGFALALVLIVVAVILITGWEVIGAERETKVMTRRLEEVDKVGFKKIDMIADVNIWNHVSALKYAAAVERAKQARELERQRTVAQTRQEAGAPSEVPPSESYRSGGNSVWDQLAQCESGGNWAIATGNGFYGGLQFTIQSWQAVGGSGMPNQASREEQISRGQALQAIQGWGAWPGCAAKLGLR